MRNLFIFGIGGTGSRVIRALNMLLAANGGMMHVKDEDGNITATRVFPIIIDYDVKNGDKLRALDSLNLYSQVHHKIYDGNTFDAQHPKDGFFSTEVLEMREVLKDQGGQSTFNLQYNPPATAKKYSDSIGYNTLNGDLQVTQQLLETLYNTSNNQEFAELHIDTTVGFRGNPNIGSVMLNNISQSKEFQEFSRICKGTTGDRVVIIGSLFGGTGSSGIPVLVNAIRNSPRTDVSNAKIATILVCPYFKIGSPDESKRHEGVIDDKIFESKTKAALYYYQDALNDKIDSIYYVGDKDKDTVQHHVGEQEQKNPAHVVELVSAMAIAHFNNLNESDFTATDATGQLKKHWKYGFDVEIDKIALLDFSMFAKQSLTDIKRLIAFAIAGRLVKSNIIENNKDCSSANFYKISGLDKSVSSKNDAEKQFMESVDDFIKFYKMYADWMTELDEGSNHRLQNFDFNSKEFCDIIKTHPFRREKRNVFGKTSMEPTLRPSDVFSEMSETYKRLHMPEGKDKEIRAGETLSYAFFHSLYEACVKTVEVKLDLKKGN